MIAPTLTTSISPFIFALVFGIIAAVIAVFIAKFAILISLALSFAVITPVLTWHLAGLGDGAKVVEEVVEAATTQDTGNKEPENNTTDETTLSVTQDAMTTAFLILTKDAGRIIQSGTRRASAAWNAIPTGPRLMIVGSVIVGLLIGLLISTFMPFFSSVLVTSTAGGVLLVETIRNLITLIWSQQTMATISSTALLAITGGIIVASIGLQLTLSRKTVKPKQLVN
jgi:hypothetical protein